MCVYEVYAKSTCIFKFHIEVPLTLLDVWRAKIDKLSIVVVLGDFTDKLILVDDLLEKDWIVAMQELTSDCPRHPLEVFE